MSRWRGERHAAAHVETNEQARDRWRLKNLARPDVPPLIVLNHVDRDAAREVYMTMEAVMKVEYQRRTGTEWPMSGLNAGSVVDEIVLAINHSRVRQASANLANLREGESNYR